MGDGDGDGEGLGDGDAVDGWTEGEASGVGLVRARAASGAGWWGLVLIEIADATEPRRIAASRTRRMGSRAGPAMAQVRNPIAAL